MKHFRRSTSFATTSLASWLLCLILVQAFLDVVTLGAVVIPGKEYIPDPELAVPAIPFGYSFDHRGNWCGRQEMLSNGSTTSNIRTAIAGETITVAMPNNLKYINLLPDGSIIDPKNPGMYVALMDEVARRGGFNWKFTIHEYLPNHHYVDEDGNEYFMTDLLVWMVQHFDISIEWWLGTTARVSRGVAFPKGWYDASIIIIARKVATEKKFNAFSWAGPFSRGVWILLVVTLVVTAVIILMFEKGDTIRPTLNIAELGQFSRKVRLQMYRCFITFTGHMDFQTKTLPGNIVSLSLSIFAVLMLAAYTANLARFLVAKSLIQTDGYSVDFIVKEGYKMCILNAAMKEVIEAAYPQAKFVLKDSDQEAFKGLMNFECDFAISGLSAWEGFLSKQNPDTDDCGLTRIGRIFKKFEGSFAVAADSGVHCSLLLREVFHIHFFEMKEDGFIQDEWDRHIKTNRKRIYEQMCPVVKKSATSTKDGSQVLNLTHMGGSFLLHGCIIVIAILCQIMGKYYDNSLRKKIVSTKLVKGISDRLSKRDYFSSRKLTSKTLKTYARSSVILDASLCNYVRKSQSQLAVNRGYDRIGVGIGSGINVDLDEDIDVDTGLGSDDIMFLEEQLRLIIEKLDSMTAQESTYERISPLYCIDQRGPTVDEIFPVQSFLTNGNKTKDEI